MIDYEVIENNIRDYLITKYSSDVTVVTLPDKEADFQKPFLKTRITVGYVDSDFEDPKSTSSTIQTEKLHLVLNVEGRVKRGVNGIYDVLTKNIQKLSGFEPENCQKIWFTKTKLVYRKEDLISYEQYFSCRTERVEDTDYDTETPVSSLTFSKT